MEWISNKKQWGTDVPFQKKNTVNKTAWKGGGKIWHLMAQSQHNNLHQFHSFRTNGCVEGDIKVKHTWLGSMPGVPWWPSPERPLAGPAGVIKRGGGEEIQRSSSPPERDSVPESLRWWFGILKLCQRVVGWIRCCKTQPSKMVCKKKCRHECIPSSVPTPQPPIGWNFLGEIGRQGLK